MVVPKKQPIPSQKKADAKPSSPSTQIAPQKIHPPAAKQPVKSRVVIRYDVGFNNHLYIRGNGADLSWDKGIKLKNIKADEWIWETEIPFHACEFKVLINDQIYEEGDNHPLQYKGCVEFTPKFS
ncbi:CBM20 domain-containing protein [Parachlamydia sp. AcF125]|uniref:CBM20 domain-containing protein n=1 Tax=Parachlamydia sp. AcF125 TaxID=2795736 RepID=UPI001BC8CBD7|nr:CBM20 domain-containing protein [Parachlamydia sp. AcF125]MBS4168187.1 hypothetical protein [Parachlamydia sp. AcF125]